MNRTVLPAPPNPDASPYAGNPTAWSRAMFQWMSAVKGRIETDSNANTTPIGPFVVGTYTPTTTINGTDATSNFVASLVTAMQGRGITSANIQRSNP